VAVEPKFDTENRKEFIDQFL